MSGQGGTGGRQERSRSGPDPSFVRKLEDDSLWTNSDRSRLERPTREPGEEAAGTPRRSAAARSRPRSKNRASRPSRRVAIIVFVVAALLVIIVGLEVNDSGSAGAGPTTHFSILPLENSITTTSVTTPATEPVTTTGVSGQTRNRLSAPVVALAFP